MPAAAIWLVPLITGAASTGAAVYATKKQGSAIKSAAKTTGAATARAERLEREAEATRQKERAEELALAKQAFDAEQAELARQTAEEQRRYDLLKAEKDADTAEERRRYEATETRLKPYREVGEVSLRELAALAAQGTQPSRIAPPPSRFPGGPMPQGRPMPELIQSASQPSMNVGGVQFKLAELDPRWNRGAA